MPRYRVYGQVTGSVYMGDYEAESPEDALGKADEAVGGMTTFCHQCANRCEDAMTEAVTAEEVTDVGGS